MSKTVITATGNNLDSSFDKRFGRAACYCIYDNITGESKFYDNEARDANHGAGIRAAEKMIEFKAEKIISGNFGPKAKDLLNKFNIQMVIIQDDDLRIQDIIDKLNQGYETP
jgi:predicted Fe-Mo cluster-binding NifX family protein